MEWSGICQLAEEVLIREWIGNGQSPLSEGHLRCLCFWLVDDAEDEHAMARLLAGLLHTAVDERCKRTAAALIALRPAFAGSDAVAVAVWGRRTANIVVATLVSADLMSPDHSAEGAKIASEEIRVRFAVDGLRLS